MKTEILMIIGGALLAILVSACKTETPSEVDNVDVAAAGKSLVAEAEVLSFTEAGNTAVFSEY